MGGLIGKLSFERHQMLAHPALEQMLDAMRHRGVHSRGIHTAPGIALGWRGEEHPAESDIASNETRSVLVVADTALTNTGDLRAELTRAGHLVRRSSDAELLAHAYEAWGDRLVDRLRGPYAFAVWDARERRLLLARDHSGMRPLFYAVLKGHGVVFASSIRALLTDPGVGRDWCPAALDAYLARGYVPAPLTPYQRISKLEPGHRLVVEGRRLRIERFEQPAMDVSDCFEEELQRAVAEQPAAASVLFSGGAASGALLTAGRPAVIIGLEQDIHELARAHAVAAALGTQSSIEIAVPAFASLVADVAAVTDEPNADASLVSHYAVCIAARRHCDAALTGHGARALWCERHPEPGPWAEADRFGIYTRRFANEVLEASPGGPHVEGAISDSLAAAAGLGAEAGIRLSFPYLHPRLVALAAARRRGHHPLRSQSPLAGDVDHIVSQRRRQPHPWMHDIIRALVPGLLLTGEFDGRGMLSPTALQQLWEEHSQGLRDHTRRFWALLMLELWFREFVDGNAVETSLAYAYARAA